MSRLFTALRRALPKDHGAVFVDGHKAYAQDVEPDARVVIVATGTSELAFTDQEVEFDGSGVAHVSDTNGQRREMRILVMVPFGVVLQTVDLLVQPERDGADS